MLTSHAGFQTPPMAQKPHVFNVWSNASLRYKNAKACPAPQSLSSILIPFRFPAFNNRPCTCCWLVFPSTAMRAGYCTCLCFLPSFPAHTGHRRPQPCLPLGPEFPANPQEVPSLQACTPDPSWGMSYPGLSCGRPPPLTWGRQKAACSRKREPLGCLNTVAI